MTMKRSWALAALALLGFGTACNEDEQILAMYGTPNVDYRVQGRVTDLEGNPIEGIEVRGKDGLKSVLSGADGSFDLMALDTLGMSKRYFEVRDFHVLSGNQRDERSAQAYIKVSVDGREEINAAEKRASENELKGVMGYNTDPITSRDILGRTEGSIFDATETKVIKADGEQFVKVFAWYDNEYSYTCQFVRLAKKLASF